MVHGLTDERSRTVDDALQSGAGAEPVVAFLVPTQIVEPVAVGGVTESLAGTVMHMV